MEWQPPTLADVLETRLRIAAHLRPTPLFGYGASSTNRQSAFARRICGIVCAFTSSRRGEQTR